MILVNKEEPETIKKAIGELGTEATLTTGDYSFFSWSGDSVGIKRRKMLNNLLGNITSGRLTDQMIKLAEEYDIAILLCEGPIFISETGNLENRYYDEVSGNYELVKVDTNWHYVDVMLSLMSIWLATGVLPLYVESEEWTPKLITELYRWFQEPSRRKRYLGSQKKSISIALGESMSEMMLGAIPGISTETAEDILSHFGNLKTLTPANEKEIMEVKGIGKVMASRIFQAVNEVYQPKDKVKEETKTECGEKISQEEQVE